MVSHDALSLDSEMLVEAKAYLRLEPDQNDSSLSAILLAALNHAEGFTGQTLLQRDVREIRNVSSVWQRLAATPVVGFTSVTGIPAEGANFVLPAISYSTEIDHHGEGQFRITQPGSAGRVEIVYQAGLVADWGELPEALRLGILRLVGYFHMNRDAVDDSGPPVAVSAFLLPWRRIRLP